MKTVTAIPAYGRDYKSKKALLEDFKNGKDFNGIGLFAIGYFSIRDKEQLLKNGFTHISFRYAKQTKIHVVELAKIEIKTIVKIGE